MAATSIGTLTRLASASFPKVAVRMNKSVTAIDASFSFEAVRARNGRLFVVALDGSGIAATALRLALALASSKDGLFVVSVETPETDANELNHPRRVLAKAETTVAATGIDYQLVHLSAKKADGVDGKVAKWRMLAGSIVSLVEAVDADLVLMGSRGLAVTAYTSATAEELGSVAAACLDVIQHPIAVVKSETASVAADAGIAMAFDGSPVSLRALRMAHGYARKMGSSLHVCSVLTATRGESALTELMASALEVEPNLDALQAIGVDVAFLDREGSVAETIMAHIEPLAPLATVLCTATIFHSEHLLGSVSRRMVRRGKFNILLVKPTEDDDA
ncbi:uncharacterized protein AMSG_00598 [Thecamonas trahens ATCC 50062]|uniref:UspA domain-containing protein n=1 Tax=Thecamonas trahens ATCC 50062 TaxID=461836 RepID=A0A0L0D8W0_THETB|nr:hypothetical protein AMSG_00598 [Thecamonas trahens ATCC 50062]KNC48817.1 hypothetical protein AMSG_00598 [Thecamonas trahens ATCC 50062]|eukprot:XP_013762868.1 hypothetical protein AMSG_00598 [Thecamonas trahens ATCC 50062]